MFPISDDNSDSHLTPYVNYIFIAINFFVFIFLQGMGTNDIFTYAFSTVPAEILTGKDIVTAGEIVRDPGTGQTFQLPGLQVTPIHPWLTTITSMFMHGGWGHILGNMLFLWIFGDNIENRLGHSRYFTFYMLCGILASLSHVFLTAYLGQNTEIPSLGASGAISGVMGGYLILFPRRKVNVLLLRFIVAVPALVALGMWILFQIISGMGMLGGQSDGVAYAAHIGGFLAGMLLIKLFDRGQKFVDDGLLKRVR
ncbi:MAG TPA: rhomboid family intramembrane serine protease [Chitinophagaceae bacterium]|nr:rhomboid family intramembrane serine protease [Chitinophagaceae bacterium]